MATGDLIVSEDNPDEPTPTPEPVAPPEAPPEEPPPPPAAPEPPDLLTAEPDATGMYPAHIVESLRAENAKYRTRARDYEQVFDGYDDEDREAWLTLVDLAKSDPDQARTIMLQLAQAEAEEVTGGHPEYLTRDEAEQLMGEQFAAFQQAQTEAQLVDGVVSEAESLGYTRDSEDYMLLLRYANAMDEPDLDAAHRQVEAYKQAWIDNYIAEKEKDAEGSPRVPSVTGQPPNLTTPPHTWEQARAAARERFDRLPG